MALFGQGLAGAGAYALHVSSVGGNALLKNKLLGAAGAPGPELSVCAGVLAGIQGRFLLSLNDWPEVREVFKAFPMRTVAQLYPSGNHSPNHEERVHELLIGSVPLALRPDSGQA